MKTVRLLAYLVAFCAVPAAQGSAPLTFNITDPSGLQPPVQLAPTYQFPNTAEGSSSPLFIEVVNSSANSVYLVGAYVANASNSIAQNVNFRMSGSFSNVTLQPGDSAVMVAHFTPLTSGSITGYFQAAFQIVQNGCTPGSSTAPCSTQISSVSTMSGTATAAELILSYLLSGGSVYLQPGNPTPVRFGNVSLGAIGSVTFKLFNQSSQSVPVPAVSVTSAGGLFQLDTSAMPSSIAANSAGSFKVSFAPSQTGMVDATLAVGNDSYVLQATGVTPVGIDTLQVSYRGTNSTPMVAQNGATISFGQIGVGSSSSLSFTVTNPSSSANSISVPTLGVTGSGFSVIGAPPVPVSILPGASMAFSVEFTESLAGSSTGTLTIGTLAYSLTGQTTGTLPSPFTFYVHDTTGALPDTPLPSLYQLASTAQGNSTPLVLKVVNSSKNTVYFIDPFVTNSGTMGEQNPNFSVTGFFTDLTMPAGGSALFTVNFSPITTGNITGYLVAAYQIQQAGCDFTSRDPATQCPSGAATVSTLSGTATAPLLTLSYTNSSGTQVALQPSSSSPLNFGNVSLSSTTKITFVLANQSTTAIATPAISLQTLLNIASAFTVDKTALASNIPAKSSTSFTVTFAPGQAGLSTGTLLVGSNAYALQGGGIITADDDSLQISYTDSTGVRGLPQAATPISFGQIVPGNTTGTVLTFTVANPTTSFNAVSLAALAVHGVDFTMTRAPAVPTSIQPGSAISFAITFTAATSGTYTGTLTIGSRQFSLTGQAVISPLPAISLRLSSQPLASQQQATVVVQLASASAVPAIGSINIQFTPSIANVSDDPAVIFAATNGRLLSLNVAAGAQVATYNGQSQLAFQTGTTEGTIAFTVNFANTAPYTQSFSIPAAAVQITSATAVRQSPNLVVTLNGYDNTYSAGALTFTFYDGSGAAIGSPLTVNESANFQQLFFNDNTAGGAFSLQASFPVTGNVANVGSVGVTMTNSSGQTSVNEVFQ